MKPLILQSGSHPTQADGMCAMEFVAYLANEDHSDHPVCVSPVIGVFCRAWNDGMNDADRNKILRPLLFRTLHTATGAADETTRSCMATDWLVRVQAPAWLDSAGLAVHATRLRGLTPLTSGEIAASVQSILDAAGAAARAAARDAAGDAARDAARDAAWAAARAAARDAAWDAARDAARDAAGDAARAAAWDAAWDAARAAAWDAARAAAWDAAGDAARDALRPTVEGLQCEAAALLVRMCEVGSTAEPRLVELQRAERFGVCY